MIATAWPIIEVLWPYIGMGIMAGALVGMWGMWKKSDREHAREIITDLERFVEVGNIRFHPILPMPDLTGEKTVVMRRIAEKYPKWLYVQGPDGENRIGRGSVVNAMNFIELLRLYGYLRAKWKIWRIYRKKVNKIP